jgi:hypothetical protein
MFTSPTVATLSISYINTLGQHMTDPACNTCRTIHGDLMDACFVEKAEAYKEFLIVGRLDGSFLRKALDDRNCFVELCFAHDGRWLSVLAGRLYDVRSIVQTLR